MHFFTISLSPIAEVTRDQFSWSQGGKGGRKGGEGGVKIDHSSIIEAAPKKVGKEDLGFLIHNRAFFRSWERSRLVKGLSLFLYKWRLFLRKYIEKAKQMFQLSWSKDYIIRL